MSESIKDINPHNNGTVTSEIMDYISSYNGKKIHCIKDLDARGRINYLTMKPIENDYIKGDFYEIISVTNLSDWTSHTKFIPFITVEDYGFVYIKFLEHFELRTLQDIRRDKIKSVLK